MSDVKQFELDGTVIDVKDTQARADASAASSAVSGLTTRVATLEALSRLTVSYNSSAEKITFTTTTH